MAPTFSSTNHCDSNDVSTNLKSQVLQDHDTMRSTSLQPSELRVLFSRTKCCEANCFVTKLRMPMVTENSIPTKVIPLTHMVYGGSCSTKRVTKNTTEPVSIEEFENMIWDAREVLRTMRVILI